jgi:Ca2+-binding EF-hand superfamily protein
LAAVADFDPQRVFKQLDADNDGKLTAQEFVDFMKQNYVDITLDQGKEVIMEFDSI